MKIFSLITIVTLFLSFISPTYAGTRVGKIKYARGAVTVQKADGSSTRLVGKGDIIERNDVIKTGPKSFAILQLIDETAMTLRPRTSFAVEEINATKGNKAKALLKLFRGGFRTVTGFISKYNPDGYRVRTPVVTIGIRGTEFDARICGVDCAQENKKLEEKQKKQVAQTIAKAVFIKGTLEARAYAGKTRTLKAGGSIFEGDTLLTGKNGYAIIVFKDKSRVSLQANTSFRVDELRFDKDDKSKRSGLFSLLRGGLRTATGLIGKLQPDNYKMRTRVVTIGIRGTGYDLLCTGACVSDNQTIQGGQNLPQGEGLYVNVWDGSITLGEQVVEKGLAAFLKDKQGKPVMLPSVPDYFISNPVPRPSTFKVDESKLFTEASSQDIPPGLYVSVKTGKVSLTSDDTSDSILLTDGTAGFADTTGQAITTLPAIPTFQALDPYPTPANFQPKTSSLGGTSLNDDEGSMVCEIK